MLAIVYSVLSYLLFLAVFAYFALFSDGIFVPRSVDVGVPTELGWALLINLALLLLWGLQHSVMARAGFKRAIVRVVPAHVERATYVLVSSLTLALLMWQWRPIGGAVWRVESDSAVVVLWLLNATGWLCAPLCTFMIDHFDLLGIKQTLHHFRRTSVSHKGFVTPLLYKYVRHPMMTSILVGLWVTPFMSAGHLLLSLGMTVYVVIGVHFEERALLRELGVDYQRYRATTPRFLPLGAPSARAVSDDPAQHRSNHAV